jgi:putative phosphoesterase
VATVAVISDIHANVVALDAVLADLELVEPDRVVCLGDVAATGPTPREVVARLKSRDWRFVRGNCDDAMLRYAAGATGDVTDEHDAIDRWCTGRLAPDDIAFLASFEPVVTIDVGGRTLCCYHGSPHSNLDEILPTTPQHDLDRWLLGQHADVYAGGHTHVPMVGRYREAFVINPGSVGLPFTSTADGGTINPAWAEYALISIERGRIGVELRRTPIDRAALMDAAAESGMPHLDWWSGDWR